MLEEKTYADEQRGKRYQYMKIFSLFMFTIGSIRLLSLFYLSEFTLLSTIIGLQITSLSIYLASYKLIKDGTKGRIYTYLDIPLSIILFISLFGIYNSVKNEKNDFERGLMTIFPILIILIFGMFIFRSIFLSIVGGGIFISFYVYVFPHVSTEQAIKSGVRLLIAISFILLAIYLYLKENKCNYLLRQQLKREEARYRQFMDLQADSIVILSSSDLTLIYQNPASKRGCLSVNEDSWAEKYSKMCVIGDEERTLLQHIDVLAEGPREYIGIEGEARNLRRKSCYRESYIDNEFRINEGVLGERGKLLNITLIGSHLFEEKGTIGVIIKDITEKRKYEENVIGNKYKTKIFNSLSHELRTPLNGIVGIIQLVKDEVNNPKLLEHLSIAESNSFYLQNQLNDILDFGQLLANNMVLHLSIFDLKDLLPQLCSSALPLLKGKSVNIVHKIGEEVPFQIHLDERRITQILTNFISNSIKYTEKGLITIFGEYKREKNILVLGVSDTGKGMTKEQINSLFEMKGEDCNLGSKCSGMGLTISQMICKKMGSKIKVRSDRRGSTFYFQLKNPFVEKNIRRRVSIFEEGTLSPEPYSPRVSLVPSFTSFISPERKNYSKKLIIITDDTATNRFVLRGLLKEFAYYLKIREACDGLESLEMAKSALLKGIKQVLIFMDLDMPVMDGIAATSAIRRLPQAHRVSIIIVTAFTTEGYRQQAEDAGIQDFFNKPVRRDLLRRSVYTYLLKKDG